MLSRYAAAAGLTHPISPHQLRHFLFTWLKTQGIGDALIQPCSGHKTDSPSRSTACNEPILSEAR
jgi:integrase/recombinase XerD